MNTVSTSACTPLVWASSGSRGLGVLQTQLKHTRRLILASASSGLTSTRLQHKWVKRTYESEQSPLLTPPRCEHAVTISRRIVWLGVSSTSPASPTVRVIKHHSRWKRGKKWNQRERYRFENVLLCYFKKKKRKKARKPSCGLSTPLVSLKSLRSCSSSQSVLIVIYLFLFLQSPTFRSHARRPRMYQNAVEAQNTLEEAGESYIWQSAANKV